MLSGHLALWMSLTVRWNSRYGMAFKYRSISVLVSPGLLLRSSSPSPNPNNVCKGFRSVILLLARFSLIRLVNPDSGS